MDAAESKHVLAPYVAAAEAYGEAVAAGDSKRVNAAHAAIQTAFDALAARDQSRAVLTLLDDARLAVRYCAAVDALNLDPARAESVLEAIMDGPPSPLRSMALVSLGEWRKRCAHG